MLITKIIAYKKSKHVVFIYLGLFLSKTLWQNCGLTPVFPLRMRSSQPMTYEPFGSCLAISKFCKSENQEIIEKKKKKRIIFQVTVQILIQLSVKLHPDTLLDQSKKVISSDFLIRQFVQPVGRLTRKRNSPYNSSIMFFQLTKRIIPRETVIHKLAEVLTQTLALWNYFRMRYMRSPNRNSFNLYLWQQCRIPGRDSLSNRVWLRGIFELFVHLSSSLSIMLFVPSLELFAVQSSSHLSDSRTSILDWEIGRL